MSVLSGLLSDILKTIVGLFLTLFFSYFMLLMFEPAFRLIGLNAYQIDLNSLLLAGLLITGIAIFNKLGRGCKNL